MSVAYVDASCLVAIAFGERRAKPLARRLGGFDDLLSSTVLEAELRSAFHREGVDFESELLSWIGWVLPDRPLGTEISQALDAGYLRGADLWHVACALYLAEDLPEMAFLTLDERQGAVAAELGFLT